jgi:integrase
MHSGLDRGAEFSLRWSQAEFQTRTIAAERRKGRREGVVPLVIPINDDLLAVLRRLPSRLTSEWVFPNAAGTSPLDGREFDRLVFRPALKRAGIRDLRWKDLRHTFATRLRMIGSDTGTIRDLLGHTTDRTTRRYAHAAPGRCTRRFSGWRAVRRPRTSRTQVTLQVTQASRDRERLVPVNAQLRVRPAKHRASPAGFEPTLPA